MKKIYNDAVGLVRKGYFVEAACKMAASIANDTSDDTYNELWTLLTNAGIISRKEAEMTGLMYYNTGGPCVNGHRADRYVSTGTCVECRKMHGKNAYEQQKTDNAGKVRTVIWVTPDQLEKIERIL